MHSPETEPIEFRRSVSEGEAVRHSPTVQECNSKGSLSFSAPPLEKSASGSSVSTSSQEGVRHRRVVSLPGDDWSQQVSGHSYNMLMLPDSQTERKCSRNSNCNR